MTTLENILLLLAGLIGLSATLLGFIWLIITNGKE